MGEKISSPESSFKGKHGSWLNKVRGEFGPSMEMGFISTGVGLKVLMLLGAINPVNLIFGALAAGYFGRRLAKKSS